MYVLNITICAGAVITVAVSLGLVGVPEMTESQATGRYALLVYTVGFSCHGYRVYKYKQQHCDNSSELNK